MKKRSAQLAALGASVAAAATTALASPCAYANTLTTYFSTDINSRERTDGGGFGIMFDLEVGSTTIDVTSFELNFNGSGFTLETFIKQGSFVGFEDSPGAWSLVSTNVFPDGSTNSVDTPTFVDIDDFSLEAGSTYGIYYTTTTQPTDLGDPLKRAGVRRSSRITDPVSDSFITINTGTVIEPKFINPIGSLPSIPSLSINYTPVPGPLPLLGAGAAFGWSRKIRKRIKSSRPEVIPTSTV